MYIGPLAHRLDFKSIDIADLFSVNMLIDSDFKALKT